MSAGARLAPFDIAELREILSYDELELDTLGDRKTALFVIIFIDKWEHADRHSPALIGLGVGVLCLLIFGQNSFMLPALLLSTALLLLITNTNFDKKKGGKDNGEIKTADEKTEIVTSPEDIITDEKEERKI